MLSHLCKVKGAKMNWLTSMKTREIIVADPEQHFPGGLLRQTHKIMKKNRVLSSIIIWSEDGQLVPTQHLLNWACLWVKQCNEPWNSSIGTLHSGTQNTPKWRSMIAKERYSTISFQISSLITRPLLINSDGTEEVRTMQVAWEDAVPMPLSKHKL